MKRTFVLLLAALLASAACVQVDNSLGKGLVDKSLLYDTYTEEFPLTQIKMKMSGDLSGYSDSHLTIGAIRDQVFGLTTRAAAFSLIPAMDTIDLGRNPHAVSFDIYFEADTISCPNDNQRGILQNLYVYELEQRLSQKEQSAMQEIPHSEDRITEGLPVYSGEGALNFGFTKAFAEKYVKALSELGPVLKERSDAEGAIDRYDDFLAAVPGIFITTDAPEGNGGRINLFNFSCLSVSSNYYYRNNNIAVLTVNSEWEGKRKDSSFVFVPGEPEFTDEVTALKDNTKFYQYCFNQTTHQSEVMPENPDTRLLVEGGTGLKPVISAKELRDHTLQAILAKGGDPDNAVIVKATIVLPYEMPENYLDMNYFPAILSPTIRTTVTSDDTDYVTFAGLTDASVSSEDQGDIDRSNLVYSPDISYHLQELLRRTDLDTATDADIWLLIIHTQKVANANGSLYDNSYYQNLLYASYYNSLYGGGYGGYGYGGYSGYGYGSSYSNYYNYMMLAQMMAASSEQTYSYTTELDKDRYYCAILNGPDAARAPKFRVTYAFPQK